MNEPMTKDGEELFQIFGNLISKSVEPSLMYSGTTGFVAGSETSEAHAQYEKERAPSVQQQVLKVLDIVIGGLTCTEIEEELGIKHQTVSSAIRNLELDNRIVKTTKKRNNQYRYVTKEQSELMLEEHLLPATPKHSWKTKYLELQKFIEEQIDSFIDDLGDKHLNPLEDGDITLALRIAFLKEQLFVLQWDIQNFSSYKTE